MLQQHCLSSFLALSSLHSLLSEEEALLVLQQHLHEADVGFADVATSSAAVVALPAFSVAAQFLPNSSYAALFHVVWLHPSVWLKPLEQLMMAQEALQAERLLCWD